MAKVYDFPVKVLPKEMEEYLYELGKEYAVRMNQAVDTFVEKYNLDISQEDLMELMVLAYIKGVADAIKEM